MDWTVEQTALRFGQKAQCASSIDLARSEPGGILYIVMNVRKSKIPYNLIITINTGPLFKEMFRNISAAILVKLRIRICTNIERGLAECLPNSFIALTMINWPGYCKYVDLI